MYIISLICRFFLCLTPYMILVTSKDIIYHITGPITIPPFNQSGETLIYWIGAIEFFRVFYQPILSILFKLTPKQTFQQHESFLNNMSIKYSIVILMKLFLMFYEIHRLKYYLHVFFLELFIIAVNIVADVVGNNKVSLVMDIVLIDSLNRVAIFYELTRTFNPNFGLYFFGNNLLTLICYMLEGERKQVLYVRHDIYRIMIVTMAYLFLFSLFQCSITYRPLIIFLSTAYFFLQTIHEFTKESNKISEQIIQNKKEQSHTLGIKTSKNKLLVKPEVMILKIRRFKQQIQGKKAIINFSILITITILIEFLFIKNEGKEYQDFSKVKNQQTVRNSFIEFYMAMKDIKNT